VPEVNVLDEGSPLFVQIAEQLADDIAEGNLAEGERVPSTNELAAYYRINPATAAKGINVLIDDGLLEKRRGIGMFVAAGARDRLLADRRKRFAEEYVDRMVIEARRLGIDDDTLIAMVRDASNGTATSDTKTSDTKISDTKISDTTGGGAA
jgi:GntR family transcriptional regulator